MNKYIYRSREVTCPICGKRFESAEEFVYVFEKKASVVCPRCYEYIALPITPGESKMVEELLMIQATWYVKDKETIFGEKRLKRYAEKEDAILDHCPYPRCGWLPEEDAMEGLPVAEVSDIRTISRLRSLGSR